MQSVYSAAPRAITKRFWAKSAIARLMASFASVFQELAPLAERFIGWLRQCNQMRFYYSTQSTFFHQCCTTWECLPMFRETGVQFQVESYQRLKKWYLISTSLILSIIKYVSRVTWRNPGKGVVPSPTPRCSSYWKGSLRVALDYSRQLYFTVFIPRDKFYTFTFVFFYVI